MDISILFIHLLAASGGKTCRAKPELLCKIVLYILKQLFAEAEVNSGGYFNFIYSPPGGFRRKNMSCETRIAM